MSTHDLVKEGRWNWWKAAFNEYLGESNVLSFTTLVHIWLLIIKTRKRYSTELHRISRAFMQSLISTLKNANCLTYPAMLFFQTNMSKTHIPAHSHANLNRACAYQLPKSLNTVEQFSKYPCLNSVGVIYDMDGKTIYCSFLSHQFLFHTTKAG